MGRNRMTLGRVFGPSLILTLMLLSAGPAAHATETIKGVLKQMQVPVCDNNCGDYYVIPDSSFAFVYVKGDQLSGFVDHHVLMVGVRSSCGGCITFFIMQISIIPETGVNEGPEELPQVTRLEQNYPNPFNPSTEIRYSLAADGFVSLRILNVLGENVEDVRAGRQPAGYHNLRWDASALPGGVYLCVMTFDGGSGRRSVSTMKMLLLR